METSIKSILPTTQKLQLVTLFAYSTHGVPGIDIVGLGKYSRLLKEKLIYLCRSRNLKLPLKRYILCLDANEDILRLDGEDYQWLEFPFFLLLLHMLELIPMQNLERCLTQGRITSLGRVEQLTLSDEMVKLINDYKFTCIHKVESSINRQIDPEDLLRLVPNIRISYTDKTFANSILSSRR